MNMNNWIDHLHHPLVLAGFGLFLFALIIKPLFLNNRNLTGTATERLLHKGMILVFLLALLAIIGGIALSWKGDKQDRVVANKPQPVTQQSSGVKTAGTTIKQTTQGTQNPAINAQGDVEVNYGE